MRFGACAEQLDGRTPTPDNLNERGHRGIEVTDRQAQLVVEVIRGHRPGRLQRTKRGIISVSNGAAALLALHDADSRLASANVRPVGFDDVAFVELEPLTHIASVSIDTLQVTISSPSSRFIPQPQCRSCPSQLKHPRAARCRTPPAGASYAFIDFYSMTPFLRSRCPPGELTVLRYLQGVLSNPEIASELCLSVNTIKTHVRNIYRKYRPLPAAMR